VNIGDLVTIKECHKMPDLEGREAKVVGLADPEVMHYPIQVFLTGDPIAMQTPFGVGETKGPFGFREDELELVKPTEIPDEFKDAFDEGETPAK
jgi:hypothetical protein